MLDAARGSGAGAVVGGLAPALGHGGNGVLLQAASKATEMTVAVSACSRRLPLGSGLSSIDWGPRAWKSAERKVMVGGCKGRKRASRNLRMLPVDAFLAMLVFGCGAAKVGAACSEHAWDSAKVVGHCQYWQFTPQM